MQIVRIFGASYSGSTALGYTLNTVDSYFFGSETYRLLTGFQKRAEQRNGHSKYPSCDMCGRNCRYWSRDLVSKIKSDEVNSLEEVYAIFAAFNPDVSIYVDGSKQLRCYQKFTPGKNLISVKHPMRMVASSAYNDRREIGFSSKEFSDTQIAISEDPERFLAYADKYLSRLLNTYRGIFASVKDGFVCQIDQMHRNDFDGFSRLSAHLGIEAGKMVPTEFSKYPVHTLGGNRVPYWMALERQRGKTVRDPRKAYYDTATSIGDWTLDDKYLLLFDAKVYAKISELDTYRRACECLGYDPEP